MSVMTYCFFFFKQKTAYEMRISDWSSDVCSSDLLADTIRSTISVRKLVNRDHGIGSPRRWLPPQPLAEHVLPLHGESPVAIKYRQIGRASCRERVCQYV